MKGNWAINQAEDRETREHGFEVTSVFLRAEFKFSTTTKLIFFSKLSKFSKISLLATLVTEGTIYENVEEKTFIGSTM